MNRLLVGLPAHPQAGPSDRWRPQLFGKKNARDIRDPVIEPLWEGVRVLAHVEHGRAVVADVDGDQLGPGIEGFDQIVAQLIPALRAERAIVDGYLTTMVVHGSVGAFADPVEAPTSTEMATQLLVGQRRRRGELVESLPDRISADDAVGFVAVDLLGVDDDTLLDIPLLERKRVLESVLAEGDLVRFGAYVRPPVDPWLGSWRSQGFRSLAYKAANSRYRPGAANEAWAIARIPRR